ncbi:MAG: YqgE/AlgH family protein [Hyphomicrobiales bacterium]
MTKPSYLTGQMLIAMPGMSDTRFEQSVICVCSHSENGAMGIIVNKATPMMSFADLFSRLDIGGRSLPAEGELMTMPVLYGGPVEPSRGFVLHTSDYFTPDSSLAIGKHLALTATIDILTAMARGEGPKRAIITLGYAGWAPGQLESEIQHNGWLHCGSDEDLLFGISHGEKYNAALRKIGVDPAMLSTDAGHA